MGRLSQIIVALVTVVSLMCAMTVTSCSTSHPATKPTAVNVIIRRPKGAASQPAPAVQHGSEVNAEFSEQLRRDGSITFRSWNGKWVGLDADTYLTGHGEMMTKADVQKKLAFIQDKYNKIKTMAAQGKSLDEIKTSQGESTAPAPPNANGAPAAATLTEVIYKEVAKKS